MRYVIPAKHELSVSGGYSHWKKPPATSDGLRCRSMCFFPPWRGTKVPGPAPSYIGRGLTVCGFAGGVVARSGMSADQEHASAQFDSMPRNAVAAGRGHNRDAAEAAGA